MNMEAMDIDSASGKCSLTSNSPATMSMVEERILEDSPFSA